MDKTQLYRACLDHITAKISETHNTIADIQAAIAGETKSSAGDKYETSREMMQQEINREQTRLHELLKQKAALDIIDPLQQPMRIQKGSMVQTDKGYFFMATSIGKLTVDTITWQVISGESPLGQQLSGKKAGDHITVNGHQSLILQIG